MVYALLILTLAAEALAAMLGAAETAVLLLPAGRVHRLAESESRGGVDLDHLAARSHRVRAVSALSFAFACGSAAVLGVSIGAVMPQLHGIAAEGLAALFAVAVTFAIAGALPRALATANPERIGLDAAPLSRVAVGALYPIARLLGGPWTWLVHVVSGEHPAPAWATSIESRGDDSDVDNVREEAEEALLEAVSDFAEKITREVMVPRTDVTALPDTVSTEEAVRIIQATGYTRLPVFHESIDDIRGVLYAKDLLVACTFSSDATVRGLARTPYFVPETKPLDELLVEMRSRTHIAIVADEYGGTAGIVTLEDLLEEIVGEISDEYDREEPLLTKLDDERYRVDARLPVDDLNELFGTIIETDADSVGGLFTELVGHIPAAGETVTVQGVRLTVDVLEGTRIRQLSVEPAEDQEGDDDA